MHFFTPYLGRFMTFVMSDIKEIKVRPNFCKDDFKALKRLSAVPIFTTGISKNLVRMSPTSGSRNLTSIIRFVLSFVKRDYKEY